MSGFSLQHLSVYSGIANSLVLDMVVIIHHIVIFYIRIDAIIMPEFFSFFIQ